MGIIYHHQFNDCSGDWFYQVQNYLPVVIRVGGINKGQISVNYFIDLFIYLYIFSFRGVLICQKGPAYYYLMSAVLVIILSEFYFMCRAVFIFMIGMHSY